MSRASRDAARGRRLADLLASTLLVCGLGTAFAADRRVAEHVTLSNGFDLICDHREVSNGRVKLYTEVDGSNFVEVAASDVASVETVSLPAPEFAENSISSAVRPAGVTVHADLTQAELHELLSAAGTRHNLDVNLLASLVRAESGGHSRAVSNKGAQGLMQLMPKTAAALGVGDSLRPEENVAGGATYLDSLLTRYNDNLALALAAYNAGPAAVDRWHGIPPYRETRLYVARIIRDFNASVKKAAKTPAVNEASLPRRSSRAAGPVAEAELTPASLTGAIRP